MKQLGWTSLLLLSGCVSMNSGPTMAEAVTALRARYIGQPQSTVLARYGAPHAEYDMADRGVHVLQWNASGTLRLHENVTTTTRGQVGDRTNTPWASPVPYQQATTTRQGYNAPVSCMLQVAIRPDGTVDAVGMSGQMGACDQFL